MYVMHNAWIGLDELEQLRPKVDLKQLDDGTAEEDDVASVYRPIGDGYKFDGMDNPDLFKKATKQVRLVRCWRKHWDIEYIVRDKERPQDMRKLTEKEAKEFDFKENPTLDVISRRRPRYSFHMISGGVELERIEDIHLKSFPIVTFHPYYVEGVFFSMVDLVKDRQLQINKTDSVMHDYISRIPKLGAMAEESAFANEMDRTRFENSRVGDSIVFQDGALVNGKVTFPGVHGLEIIGYYNGLKEVMKEEFKEIGGVHDVLQGIKPKGAESGIAFQILRNQGITVLEPIFDNFLATKKQMGRIEVEMIQKFFPPEKIDRILGSVAQRYKNEDFANIWAMAQDDETARAKLVETLMTTNYDLVLDESVTTPVVRQANSGILMEMMKAGLPVDPQVLIDSTDLSEDLKERMKVYIQNMQQIQGMQGAV
jgi:hypothetical protein